MHLERAEVPESLRGELELAWLLLDLGLRTEAAGELERYLAVHRGRADELLPALAALEQAERTDRSVPIAQQLLQGRPAPLEFRHSTASTTGSTMLPDSPPNAPTAAAWASMAKA